MSERSWFWATAFSCLLLYLPGLFGPLTFDSVGVLSLNTALGENPGSLQAWLTAVDSSEAGPTGRPVSMLTFALSHGLAGHWPALEKGINLLIHLGIGLLLYHWLLALLQHAPAFGWHREQSRQVAFATALLWLFNPMQLSTVLYAVQRMEQLSALFTLAGLYLYTRYRIRWLEQVAKPAELSHLAFLLAVAGLLAVFSKEDGILLLPLLALVEAVLFGGKYNGKVNTALRLGAVLLCLVPVMAVIGIALIEPAWLQNWRSWRGIGIAERLLTQGRVLWHYLSWFYWPDVSRMSLFHDDIAVSRGWMLPWTSAAATAAWVAVLAASLAVVRRLPVALFGLAFFLFNHGIESTVIPLDLVYEHRSYLGNAGLALLLVAILYRWVPAANRRLALVMLLLPFMAALAWRSVLWSDELRLYESQLRYHPTSERTVYYYANLRMRLAASTEDDAETREHVLAARRYFEYLLELDPLHAPAVVSLLYIESRWFPGLSRENRVANLWSIAEQRKFEPSDLRAMDLLLRCSLAGYCEIPEQQLVAMIETLARRYPGSAAFPAFLAQYYGQLQGDLKRAMDYSRAAIAAAPDDPGGYYQLASWQLAAGEPARAAQVLGQLLGRDAGLPVVREVERVLN